MDSSERSPRFLSSAARSAMLGAFVQADSDDLDSAEVRCSYILAHTPCAPAGYIDYAKKKKTTFTSSTAPAASGYAAVLLWLVLLFYLIGDTASESFYASLRASPPAGARVTLLSLGNGAPDVFTSVVSFAAVEGRGGGVGPNNALGGALFVSTGGGRGRHARSRVARRSRRGAARVRLLSLVVLVRILLTKQV
ncbi:hypothetical protein QYE76_071581 [Lolium multiflorum]|uniref:Sodium/calcium exchanger membrane region domain-containing protein n=1 Tax=Lolium multiflorum TaxID=4521 RepID=A0AAD8WEQ8_LOLMU|nr:hypothetical protein QYE76_071581 [Lolium multiflorum]